MMNSQGRSASKVFSGIAQTAALSFASLGLGACGVDLAMVGLGSASLDGLSEAVRAGACAVEVDQSESFLPRLSSIIDGAVTVVVDASFTVAEREMIDAAADSWNAWGRAALGHDVFKVTSGKLTGDTAPDSGNDPCAFEVPVSDGGFAIRRGMDSDSWNSFGLGDMNPAATLRCRRSDQLTQQLMVVQADWLDTRQFESVVLHEFGHALGLDHSCSDEGGSEGFAACSELPMGHEYREAVMYPSLKSRITTVSEKDGSVTTEPEIREVLTSNDADRASCLFLHDSEGGAFASVRTATARTSSESYVGEIPGEFRGEFHGVFPGGSQ